VIINQLDALKPEKKGVLTFGESLKPNSELEEINQIITETKNP
jgi:hypothetical protein